MSGRPRFCDSAGFMVEIVLLSSVGNGERTAVVLVNRIHNVICTFVGVLWC